MIKLVSLHQVYPPPPTHILKKSNYTLNKLATHKDMNFLNNYIKSNKVFITTGQISIT